jgi:hypothetical protein
MPRFSTPPIPPARNVALDNLRVAAMLLGLVTHGVLPFTATGLAPFPIRDVTRHPAADAVYFAVHDFRMQLFFLLAGFAAASLAAKKGVGAVVRNRLARVALPLGLAVVLICPGMHLLFARHTAARGVAWNPADAGGWVGPNFHLWFLYYLLLCCVPLVAVLAVRHRLPRRAVRVFDRAARRLVASPWKLPLLAIAGVPVLWGMRSWWIDTPHGWVPDAAVLAYYLGFFAAGTVLARHRDLLPCIGRHWPGQLLAANLLVLPAMLKLTVSGNWAEESGAPPAGFAAWKAAAIFLGGLYTWLTIGGLIGLFQRHFAAAGGPWKYLVEASYWCYLAGFPVQAALQVCFAPHAIPIPVEFLLVNALTFAVLLVSYEYAVRRTWVGAMLNGRREPAAELAGARVAVPEPRLGVRIGEPAARTSVHQERVGLLLVPDRRDRAVAGVHHRVRRQRPQLRHDPRLQQFEAAAGEVGPADAAAEQHVPAQERERLRLADEVDDVPRRVPRHVEHLQLDARDRERLPLAHQPVGRRAGDRHAERGAHVHLRVGEHLGVQEPDDDRGVREVVLHRRVPGDVIDVPVRVHDRREPQPAGGQHLADQVRLEAGVDDERLGRPVPPHDVRVLGERLGHDRLDLDRHG